MGDSDVFERLQAARNSLRSCLSELDGGAPDDVDVGRRFDSMREAFSDLGDLAALWDEIDEDDGDRLQEGLEELMRLNSVLTRVVQRDEERLLAELKHTRQGRMGLEALRQPTDSGGTCDFSG